MGGHQEAGHRNAGRRWQGAGHLSGAGRGCQARAGLATLAAEKIAGRWRTDLGPGPDSRCTSAWSWSSLSEPCPVAGEAGHAGGARRRPTWTKTIGETVSRPNCDAHCAARWRSSWPPVRPPGPAVPASTPRPTPSAAVEAPTPDTAATEAAEPDLPRTPVAAPTRAVTSWAPPPRTKSSGCVSSGGLPDPACTPGAVDPRVSQSTAGQTVWTRGYTATVRPPKDVTDRIKREQMAAYGLAGQSPSSVELDHLIALELGGAPADLANLWPQPWTGEPMRTRRTRSRTSCASACVGARSRWSTPSVRSRPTGSPSTSRTA
jgi:hypothetical protein